MIVLLVIAVIGALGLLTWGLSALIAYVWRRIRESQEQNNSRKEALQKSREEAYRRYVETSKEIHAARYPHGLIYEPSRGDITTDQVDQIIAQWKNNLSKGEND